MSPLGIAATVILGALGLLLGYGIVAYVVLFYLVAPDRLSTGMVLDAAYAFTLPFVLSVSWLRTVRGP